jgi:hydroxyacylglutathione hydrolase
MGARVPHRALRVKPLSLGPLGGRSYLLEEEGEALIVDPGGDPEGIFKALEGLKPRAILLTHAHWDHVGAVAPLVEALGLPIFLHPKDLPLYREAATAAAAWGYSIPQPPLPSGELREGSLGLFELEVIHLPGHSPGHVAFYRQGVLISGDLLFRDGIGRYDLPGGSWEELKTSLLRVLQLPGETLVYPGHGPETTLARERAHNPWLRF